MREWNGRNWKLFDLNIIAHLLVKGFLKKVPILKNTAYDVFSIFFRFFFDFFSIFFDFFDFFRFFFRLFFDFCLAAKPLSGKRRSADVLCHPQGRILA